MGGPRVSQEDVRYLLNKGAPKAIWRLYATLRKGRDEQTLWLLVARHLPLLKDVVRLIQSYVAARNLPKEYPFKIQVSTFVAYAHQHPPEIVRDVWLARDLIYPHRKEQTIWLLISKHHPLWSGLPTELVLMVQEYAATQNRKRYFTYVAYDDIYRFY